MHLRRFLAVLSSLALALTGVLIAAPSASAAPAPSQRYYLSLGDSLGFGYQEAKLPAGYTDPAMFDTGYTDDLAAMLARRYPGLSTENLSCPGETTASMINGDCPYTAAGALLHTNYAGPQLAFAVKFLKAHPGQVPLVTLSIGANDVLGVATQCLNLSTCPFGQLAQSTDTAGRNIGTILGQLHAAAPAATIIWLAPYDPFGFAYPDTTLLVAGIDAYWTRIVARNHDLTANAFIPINILRAPRSGCSTLVYFCPPKSTDIHPTDAGYRVIAQTFWFTYVWR